MKQEWGVESSWALTVGQYRELLQWVKDEATKTDEIPF